MVRGQAVNACLGLSAVRAGGSVVVTFGGAKPSLAVVPQIARSAEICVEGRTVKRRR